MYCVALYTCSPCVLLSTCHLSGAHTGMLHLTMFPTEEEGFQSFKLLSKSKLVVLINFTIEINFSCFGFQHIFISKCHLHHTFSDFTKVSDLFRIYTSHKSIGDINIHSHINENRVSIQKNKKIPKIPKISKIPKIPKIPKI